MDDRKKIAIGVALLGVVVFAGILVNRLYRAAPIAAPAETPAAAPPPAPAPVSAEPLPRLEDSDDLVRRKAGWMSANPLFAEWLKGEDLIAKAVAGLNMVAGGRVPGESLSFLGPKRRFSVASRNGATVINPKSYARYDAAGDFVASLDAAAAAKVFRELKPLFQTAWKGLGEKDRDVQDVVVAAAQELLKTPVPAGDVRVKPSQKGIGYAFADESLEGLSPAQKQLLRMGPRNQAKIQGKLREILGALGASGTAAAP